MMVRMLAKYLSGAALAAAIPGAALAQEAQPASPDQSSTSQVQAPTAAAAPTAGGDSRLDEIVVTATRTGETKAQSTPLAITVLSADKLNSSLAVNVKDLVSITPNLNVAQVTASAVIYIRGIGSNNVFAGSDPDVTVQSDGVYIARAFGQFADFVDVQRIEVLRGPQGTLYGRNAVGGTINIISRLPSDEFHAKVQLTGGNYGLFQGQAYVSGPLIPGKLQVSLTGNYIRHNDYIENITPGAKGVSNADRGGVRGQIRFLPTDNIEMITRADYNRSDERFDSYDHTLAPVAGATGSNSIIGDYTKTAIDAPQLEHVRIGGVAEEINVHLDDQLSLKSLTAYRHSKYNLIVDVDGTDLNNQIGLQRETSRQVSQEFDVNYNTSRFQGVAGFFYFHDHDTTFVQSSRGIRVTPESYARSLAGFAQGIYHITDRLSATAGIRYTADRKSIDQNFSRFNPATGAIVSSFTPDVGNNYHAWTPKFGLDYKITDSVLAYASATRGYKSGGTNYAAASLAALTFKPEKIWAYEGGIKSEFLDHRVRLNLTGFYYDYTGLQVQQLLGPGNVAIGNAKSAKVKGLEIESTAKPIPNLLLSANYSLLRTHYGTFTNAAVAGALVPFLTGNPDYNATAGTFNATGNRLNAAPRSSYFGSAQYDVPLDFGGKAFLRGEYYHQSKVFYDPSNVDIFAQKAYHLVNAAIGYTSEDSKFSIQVVGKNLTYSHYLITIAANGLVPAGLAGAPRTVAVQVTKSF